MAAASVLGAAAAATAATAPAATDSEAGREAGREAGAGAGATTTTTELLDAHDTVLTACALETTCWRGSDSDSTGSGSAAGDGDCSCYAVCGTYQLVKGPEGSGSQADRRDGSLLLYRLDRGDAGPEKGEEEEEEEGAAQPRLVPVQALRLEDEGVLDCKWRPAGRRRLLLGCATSRGRIATYALRELEEEGEDGGVGLVPGPASSSSSSSSSSSLGEDDDGGRQPPYMALALEWARAPAAGEATVASSNNDGSVCVHRLRDEGAELVETARWDAHSLYGSPIEVWTAAFADRAGRLLLTGGDDCALRCWDLRCLDPGNPTPVWADARSHGAGVTSLQAFGDTYDDEEEESWYFASGSYDGMLRLWDRRQPGQPVLAQETDVGGGVWRIKWRRPRPLTPRRASGLPMPRLLALACMHAGAAVLRFGESDQGQPQQQQETKTPGAWVREPATVVSRHEAHASMAYGIDWCDCRCGGAHDAEDAASQQLPPPPLLASCSFYDHALHLWRPRPRRRVPP